MYLAVAPGSDRCYRVGNGPVQRNITYELYDNEGQFMSGATIKEELVALEGSLPVTGRESSSPPIYRDQLSTLSGGLAFSCNVSESRHCQESLITSVSLICRSSFVDSVATGVSCT
jgi:hypothetical protein